MSVQGHPFLNVAGFTDHIQVIECPSANRESPTRVKERKGGGCFGVSGLKTWTKQERRGEAGTAGDGAGDAGARAGRGSERGAQAPRGTDEDSAALDDDRHQQPGRGGHAADQPPSKSPWGHGAQNTRLCSDAH